MTCIFLTVTRPSPSDTSTPSPLGSGTGGGPWPESVLARGRSCLWIRQRRPVAQAPHTVLMQTRPRCSARLKVLGALLALSLLGDCGPPGHVPPPCAAGVGGGGRRVCQPSHCLFSRGLGQLDPARPVRTPGPAGPRPVLRKPPGKLGCGRVLCRAGASPGVCPCLCAAWRCVSGIGAVLRPQASGRHTLRCAASVACLFLKAHSQNLCGSCVQS